MKVGTKFCGGCNPKYDRINALEYMKVQLENYKFSYVKDEEIYDYIVIICGCHAICASHGNIKFTKEKFILKSIDDVQKIVDKLKKQ